MMLLRTKWTRLQSKLSAGNKAGGAEHRQDIKAMNEPQSFHETCLLESEQQHVIHSVIKTQEVWNKEPYVM